MATVHGNGPWQGVAILRWDDRRERRIVLTPPMDDMCEALAQAVEVIARVRAEMRAEVPPGYQW